MNKKMTEDENETVPLFKGEMAFYVVGIEDGIYDVCWDVDAHRYMFVEKKTGREVYGNLDSFSSLDILVTGVSMDKGEYHISFELDAYRYRLVDQESGREFYADARTFFIEDFDDEYTDEVE